VFRVPPLSFWIVSSQKEKGGTFGFSPSLFHVPSRTARNGPFFHFPPLPFYMTQTGEDKQSTLVPPFFPFCAVPFLFSFSWDYGIAAAENWEPTSLPLSPPPTSPPSFEEGNEVVHAASPFFFSFSFYAPLFPPSLLCLDSWWSHRSIRISGWPNLHASFLFSSFFLISLSRR